MENWWESPYIIILYYRGFTCGKFVSNILSFNKNFVAQIFTHVPFKNPNIVKRFDPGITILAQVPKFDHSIEAFLTEFKIKKIFDTIPASKEECKKWIEYELGCEIWISNDRRRTNNIGKHLLGNKKYCFMVAHDRNELSEYLNNYPNAQVIEIVNDDEIYRQSVNLKTPNPDEMKINPVVPYEHSIKFEIASLFDKVKFFQNINKLLDDLKIADKEFDNRVYDYYNQYTNLYN